MFERLWKYNKRVVHDGRKNTLTLKKDQHKQVLLLLEDKRAKGEASICVSNEWERSIVINQEEEEVQFSLIGKPRLVLTNMNLSYLHVEIQAIIDEFVDIVIDESLNALPTIRDISHLIYHIEGSFLPNKVYYRMTHKGM